MSISAVCCCLTLKLSSLKPRCCIISHGSGWLGCSSATLTWVPHPHRGAQPEGQPSPTWLALGTTVLILMASLCLVVKPAFFHGDQGSVSRDQSWSYKASWGLGSGYPTVSWSYILLGEAKNQKTSLDTQEVGKQTSTISMDSLWLSQLHCREFYLCQLWF